MGNYYYAILIERTEKEVAIMGQAADRYIFKQELKLLYMDYMRCDDGAVKREIAKDIQLLRKAIALII